MIKNIAFSHINNSYIVSPTTPSPVTRGKDTLYPSMLDHMKEVYFSVTVFKTSLLRYSRSNAPKHIAFSVRYPDYFGQQCLDAGAGCN
jgi:hypothetical protein